MKNKPCLHKLQKGHCRICRPDNYCAHSKHRSHCRLCHPLGWAKGCLSVFRGDAKRHGYKAPNIPPEQFVARMKQTKRCTACNGRLNWLKKPHPHLHHNHETGEVIGFCHPVCNQAEGMLAKLTHQERINFLACFFPEVFEI